MHSTLKDTHNTFGEIDDAIFITIQALLIANKNCTSNYGKCDRSNVNQESDCKL